MTTTLDDLERIEFKKGEYLFREGEQSFHFFMIEEGNVEIILQNPNNVGEGLRVATLGPGQPVGEFALITKQPRSATARARTDCRAVKISGEGYQELLKQLPEWAMSLIASLIDRLRTTDDKIRKSQFRDEATRSEIFNILNSNTR